MQTMIIEELTHQPFAKSRNLFYHFPIINHNSLRYYHLYNVDEKIDFMAEKQITTAGHL